jgi:adenylosuccinate synthase
LWLDRSCGVEICLHDKRGYKIVMTKADVLDAFEELQVCTAYNADGNNTEEVPYQMTGINLDPVYKKFKGWKTDSSVLKNEKELPAAMQQYVQFINQYLGSKGELYFKRTGPGPDSFAILKKEQQKNKNKNLEVSKTSLKFYID